MTDEALVCWKCGAPLADIPLPLSRYNPCRACGADLYVCRMCEHFDARRVNACREERAEPPLSKDTANFCDWFRPTPRAYAGANSATDAARAQLDALFGGAAAPSSGMAPGDELERLFRKD